MQSLLKSEAELYLKDIGMGIGDWNQVIDLTDGKSIDTNLVQQKAPDKYLLNFCQHVAGWLPSGDWKIFQIDNSTGWMDPVHASMFYGLLHGSDFLSKIDYPEKRSYLFEFSQDKRQMMNQELLLANLIYVFLLFESHGYIVSSGSQQGQVIAIQDGVIYMASRNGNAIDAKKILKSYSENPSKSPNWVLEFMQEEQEASILSA